MKPNQLTNEKIPVTKATKKVTEKVDQTTEQETDNQDAEKEPNPNNWLNDKEQQEKDPLNFFDDVTDEEEEEELEEGSQTEEEGLKEKEQRLRQEIETIQTKLKQKEEEKGHVHQDEERRTLQKQAEEILRIGAMPLCPPGRRNWTEEGVLTVEVGVRNISWPPIGYKQMTPDEKLLAWEYVSMRLQEEAEGKFPRMSRQLLLDTYNFLALPGTRKAYNQQDRSSRKARFYNYQLVRQVAKGDLFTDESRSIVESLYHFQKQLKKTPAQRMASQLDVTKVRLRLDKD